jgi:hypothetical protein
MANVVFFARVVGTTGAFTAAVGTGAGTVPNPICSVETTCVAARTGAGVYTLTFATALPVGEYLYEAACEGAAANGNAQTSVAGAVLTVSTSIAAVATDENFWVKITRIAELDS